MADDAVCDSRRMAAEYDAKPREIRNFAIVQLALTAGFLALLVWMFDAVDADPPPVWQWVVLLGAVAVGGLLAERVWLAADPLPPHTDDPTSTALAIYAGQTVRRLAICEVPILLGIGFAFLTDHAAWPVLIAGVPGLVVLAIEIWPSGRHLSLTETVLDGAGARTRLLESFDA